MERKQRAEIKKRSGREQGRGLASLGPGAPGVWHSWGLACGTT